MKKSTLSEILGITGIIVSILLLIFSWTQLSETIPAHFNFKGEANVFAPKWMLFLIPVFCSGLYFLFSLMIAKPGIVKNYPYRITDNKKEAHYAVIRSMGRWLRISVIWTFTYVEFAFINASVKWIELSGLTILIPIFITVIGVILLQGRGKNI
jgi:uncharacterized membrane protein